MHKRLDTMTKDDWETEEEREERELRALQAPPLVETNEPEENPGAAAA